MRILHVVPTYLPATRYGGPIYSVHNLCRSLVEKGHEISVFTTNVDGDHDSDVPLGEAVDIDGVQVWYFHSLFLRRIYYSPPLMKALKDQLNEFNLVHIHSVYLWPTWAAARVARSTKVPYILSPRGMLVKHLIERKSRLLKTAWIGLIEKKNIEGAEALHVTSRQEENDLQAFGFDLPKVINTPNGINSSKVCCGFKLSGDVRKVINKRDYVLFLGRINWKKGLDRLIRAWRYTRDIKLVIAGNDEENYLPGLYEIAKEEGVIKKITFIPRQIEGADKEALYSSASLFVLPSYSENFGNTVLEAMIRGIPVVVTEEVGAGEVVKEVQGGLVVKGDPSSLAKGINELLSDPEKRQKITKSAQRQVMEKYSWQAVASKMEVAYQKMLQNTRR